MTTIQIATLVARSPSRVPFWRRAIRDGRVLTGAILLVLVLLVAFLGPFVAPYPYAKFVAVPFSQPSAAHLLGTDVRGYDVFSRLLNGGVTVVTMSVLAALVGMCIGVPIGLVAAYKRSWLDELIMRCTDVMMAFPQIVFTLLFVTMFGHPLWLLVLLVAIGHSPQIIRVTRAVSLEVTEREFVEHSEALGASSLRIVLTQVLPNIAPTLAVEFGLRTVWTVSTLASISVLGFGVSAPAADWGLMVNENRSALLTQPWGVVAPLLMIAIFAVGTNLVADGCSKLIGRK